MSSPPSFGSAPFGAMPFGPPPSLLFTASGPGTLVIAGGTGTAANFWHTQTNYTSAFIAIPSLLSGVGLDLRQWGGDVNASAFILANLGALHINTAFHLGASSGLMYFAGQRGTVPYLGFNIDAANAFSFADVNNDYFSIVPSTGVGIFRTSPASALDVGGVVTIRPVATPASPSASSEAREYISATGYAVHQYNDAGTVRFKYLPLFGTSVTWVESTTAP